MKNCPVCGKELDDSATFCTECGATLEETKAEVATETPVAAPVAEKKAKVPAGPEPIWLLLVNFVSNLFSMLAVLFAGIAIANPYFNVDVGISSYTYSLYSYETLHPNTACGVVAFVLSIIAIFFATITIILTIVKRSGAEKIVTRVTKYVFDILLIIFTICISFIF